MTSWEKVQQHQGVVAPHDNGANVLDDFANLIKGTNDCTSTYIQNDGHLKISANCRANDTRAIVTNYEEECMLQYARAYQIPNRNQELLNTLQSDKRLLEQKCKKLNSIKNKIQTIATQLTQNTTEESYRASDDFMSSLDEPPDTVQQQHAITTNLLTELSDFSQYLQNLQGNIQPRQIIGRTDKFIETIERLIGAIDQENETINNAEEIIEKLHLVKDEDLRFISILERLINGGYQDGLAVKLLNALADDLEYVFEIDRNDLFENIIEDLPDDNQYHTEHRMAVDIGRNDARNNDDDYIGISRTCCAICYYIVNRHYGHNVAGTHGSYCNGDALIGLSLHSDDEQKEILRGLFPELNIDSSSDSGSDGSTENNSNGINLPFGVIHRKNSLEYMAGIDFDPNGFPSSESGSDDMMWD